MALPAIAAAIGGVLVNVAGSVAGQVLARVGVAVVTYIGVQQTLDWAVSQAVQNFQLLPPEAMNIVRLMKVGECISIVTSAIAVRALGKGMTGGSIKRWVLK